MMAYTIRTEPAMIERDCNSSDAHSTKYPGSIRAIEDWARAEKQKISPPLIEPKARARNEVRTAAETSNTLLYSSDLGATINCRKPRRHPRMKAIGRSMRRASKAKLELIT